MFGLKLKQHIFHPLEIVDRGSEKQLQVGEKLICQCSTIMG